MKYSNTAILLLATCLSAPAFAQDPSSPVEAETNGDEGTAIIVTGSRIKQDPTKSAAPLQVITPSDLSREGINSPEQLISFLSTNGTGANNLASNGDVTSGAQRGTNGLSAANLRGQGAAATLVLLNGRRVAAHGLTGGAVDVNQVPFAALERVEVLKDGAPPFTAPTQLVALSTLSRNRIFKVLCLTASPTLPNVMTARFIACLAPLAMVTSTPKVSTSWVRLAKAGIPACLAKIVIL